MNIATRLWPYGIVVVCHNSMLQLYNSASPKSFWNDLNSHIVKNPTKFDTLTRFNFCEEKKCLLVFPPQIPDGLSKLMKNNAKKKTRVQKSILNKLVSADQNKLEIYLYFSILLRFLSSMAQKCYMTCWCMHFAIGIWLLE